MYLESHWISVLQVIWLTADLYLTIYLFKIQYCPFTILQLATEDALNLK